LSARFARLRRARFRLVVSEWGGKLGNPPMLRSGTLCAAGWAAALLADSEAKPMRADKRGR
jgi:hypothetical protein